MGVLVALGRLPGRNEGVIRPRRAGYNPRWSFKFRFVAKKKVEIAVTVHIKQVTVYHVRLKRVIAGSYRNCPIASLQYKGFALPPPPPEMTVLYTEVNMTLLIYWSL